MRSSHRLFGVLALALINLILLGFALRLGAADVRDGAGSVTTGYNVAASITATLAVVVGIQFLRVAPELRASLQAYGLAAQALHALGHLARWYYTYRWFDDTLHIALLLGAGVLALRLAEAWNLFPPWYATRIRAAVVALVAAIALAGLWEIFEFTMDTLQSTREQDDLQDTMLDMIDGTIGGALGAAYAALRPTPPRDRAQE